MDKMLYAAASWKYNFYERYARKLAAILALCSFPPGRSGILPPRSWSPPLSPDHYQGGQAAM